MMIPHDLRQRLIHTLLSVPSASDRAGRDTLLAGIPHMALGRSDSPYTDIANLVRQLESLGTLTDTKQSALLRMAENACMQVAGTGLGEELDAIISELKNHYSGMPKPRPAENPIPDKNEFRKTLTQALLDCSAMSDRSMRDTVVAELPPAIRHKIFRHDNAKADVLKIVEACMDYENGIMELLEAVRFFEGDSNCMKTVERIIQNGFGNS